METKAECADCCEKLEIEKVSVETLVGGVEYVVMHIRPCETCIDAEIRCAVNDSQ